MSDPHNYYADSMGYSVPEYGTKPKTGKPKDKPKPKASGYDFYKPKPKPKPKTGYLQDGEDDDSITDSIIGVAVDVAAEALLGD